MSLRSAGARALAFAVAAVAILAAPLPGRAAPGGPVAGERIYRQGLLPSGAPLHGRRENETAVEGAAAACVNCHRRSGLGTIEGPYLAPPITDKYLRRSAQINAADLNMAHVEGYHPHHAPYTDESLERALRSGISSDGVALSPLMPRYELDETSMRELLAYLRDLGAGPVPGVDETTLQFATIVTPEADPAERDAMLAVLDRFFANQSDVIAAETRPMKASREIRYRVTRKWHLNVWRLEGEPQTWSRQLHDLMQAQPVFAVISGIGGPHWEPVHEFCESEHVPCMFPNVDVPTVHEKDFYPVYFSRGVLLEADLIAGWLQRNEADARSRRVVQVFRHDDSGAAAAAALAHALSPRGWQSVERSLKPSAGAKDLSAAVQDLHEGDVLVLWLRPSDLSLLPVRPPAAADILVSGRMAGLDAAPLPEQWQARTHLSYPVDLPERRLARMNFPFGWFKVQNIPIRSERTQVDTYLACVILSETLGHMFDSFVPEYLLERLEMMVSRRLANAYFPRLGLAPGQRFASKGGYIVHFDGGGAVPAAMFSNADPGTGRGAHVISDTEWMVP